MKGIFLFMLSGYLFKLHLLENSIALNTSENTFSIDDSFKPSNYLADYPPFFLNLQQNGTERNLCVLSDKKKIDFKKLSQEYTHTKTMVQCLDTNN